MEKSELSPRCAKCGKRPDEIDEYVSAAEDEDMTPDEFVKREEGTFNPMANTFFCTACYCEVGMPLGVAPGREVD